MRAIAFVVVLSSIGCKGKGGDGGGAQTTNQPVVVANEKSPLTRDASADAEKLTLPPNLAATGETNDISQILACKNGRDVQPPQLPWPVGPPPGGYTSVWCEAENTALTGPYVALHKTDQKAASGHRNNGRPDGKWTYFYETGERLLEGTYRDGVADGVWRVYDKKGGTLQIGCFKGGAEQWKRMDADDNVPSC
jgi:hypothetical protein